MAARLIGQGDLRSAGNKGRALLSRSHTGAQEGPLKSGVGDLGAERPGKPAISTRFRLFLDGWHAERSPDPRVRSPLMGKRSVKRMREARACSYGLAAVSCWRAGLPGHDEVAAQTGGLLRCALADRVAAE